MNILAFPARAICICWLLLLCALPAIAEPPFQNGDRVLFLGDSITQDGKYVALVEAYLWATYPQLEVNFMNAGLSSETVSGITEPIHPHPRPNVHDRLAEALDISKPNWVVVCYGMNDGIYHPVEPRIIDSYRDGLTSLVDEIAARKAKVILVTPPSFDVDAAAIQANLKAAKDDEPYGYKKPYLKYDETLVALADVVKSLEKHKAVDRVIDLHAATQDYLRRVKAAKPDYQYGDGVHPPVDGHLAIARCLLENLGCDAVRASDTLLRLTGLATPVDQEQPPTSEQTKVRNALFARSAAKSAAYRKAIAVPSPVDSAALDAADQTANEAEQSLRTSISALLRDDEVLVPYQAVATKKWEKDIAALEKLDLTESYPDDAVLFIGSSSFRLWESIAQDMSPYTPIRRGYGGAKYSDLAVFAQRLIAPHKYRAVVVFVGNDVSGKPDDHSPAEVERLARYVCDVSLEHEPTAPVFLIEVTPTPLRFEYWSTIREVNARLRDIALTKPGIHFIDTAEQYLGENKLPRKELFRDDRLHQNGGGYELWSALIRQRLDEVFAASNP